MSSTNRKQKQLRSAQSGMVSILVVTFIMIVLGLITMAFTRLVNREQRQVLDRQLNTQAFYAAESGVNDVINLINTLRETGGSLQSKPDCGPSGQLNDPTKYELDAAKGIGYSCLLVNHTVPDIIINPLQAKDSKVLTLRREDNGNLSRVQFYWEDTDGGSNVCNPSNFPPNMNGCDAGVLRVDIVPFNGSTNRSQLASSTATVFFRPGSGGVSGEASYGSATGNNQGLVVTARCAAGQIRLCEGNITNLPAGARFYARIKPLYRPAALTICSPVCGSGAAQLADAQAIVDVTGKASDVLRRIQVRLPLSGIATESLQFPLQTGSTFCKLLEVAPPNHVDPNGC